MAPRRKFQVRTKYAPWMSNNTKERIKLRKKAQEKATETNSTEDWKEYKKQRNAVNSILRKEKVLWQKRKLEENSDDIRSTWQNLKKWLGWRSGGPPTKLIKNGELFSKPAVLANIMNQFFITKVRKLRESIPLSQGDPLDLTRKLLSGNRSQSEQFIQMRSAK